MKTRIVQGGRCVVPDLEFDSPVGVYRIFGPNTKSYIGSTLNLKKRSHAHWRDFQCNASPSKELTELVAKIGFEKLTFEVLEYLPADTPKKSIELLDAEERHAREYASRGKLLNQQVAMTWTEEKRNKQRKGGKLDMTPYELRLKIRALLKQVDYFTKRLEELGPLAG